MRSVLCKPELGLLAFMMLGTIGLSWVGGAQASTIACTADMADNFSGNDGCQYSSLDNPNDDQAFVNNEAFFGFSDWTISGSPGSSSPPLSGNLSGASGSFSISGLALNLDALIIVKDGEGTAPVGYLYLADANGNYIWSSPFLDPPFNLPGNSTVHDVSHFTLYTRDPGTSVSEPASLLLLGAGLAGLGIWRRKVS